MWDGGWAVPHASAEKVSTGVGLYGADLEQLQQLAGDFERWADAITRIGGEATEGARRLDGLWHGPAAMEFTAVWVRRHHPVLDRAADELRAAAGTVEENRRAQADASSADAGGWLRGHEAARDRAAGGWVRGHETVGDKAAGDRAAGDDPAWWDGAWWGGFDDLDDAALGALMTALRVVKVGLNEGPLGSLLDYQAVRDVWNREVNPVLVGALFLQIESMLAPWRALNGGPRSEPRGDLDAWAPDTGFPVRTSGQEGGPEPFTVSGGTAADRGRNALVEALRDTADVDQIRNDEFQIVDHGNGAYTLVLPGVTDLRSPNWGLDDAHRSVRDTDYAAARSTAGTDLADNMYARMVRDYVKATVPPGASISIVGHSFGADTALDLAADPVFNGKDYTITHVLAAAYHSEPQLADVQDGTRVLVVQNNKDIPVMIEELGHASSTEQIFPRVPEEIIIREFDGGWAGAGHAQQNYIDHLLSGDPAIEGFLAGWADAGYGVGGEATAVDVSVPQGGYGR